MSTLAQRLRRGAVRHMALDRAIAGRIATTPRLALDRASQRRIDQDGHLHVASSVISAAQVNPYYGRELDLDGRLGLRPDRVYQMLRDPTELAKAAASFAGKPVVDQHRPQVANDHDASIVVGTVNNPVWDAPTLKAELTLWDDDAIRAVQDGSQCALSCGYRFDLDMRPGTYQGKAYDGRFINIRGNHVCLVPEGRVAGAMVGDATPFKRRLRMATDANGGDDLYDRLIAFLADKLETTDLTQVVQMLGGDEGSDGTVGDDVYSGVARPAGSPLPGGGKVPGRQAMDAASRRADHVARSKAYAERFPNAGRLATGTR